MNKTLSNPLNKKQAIAVLIWLPVHVLLLPFLAGVLLYAGVVGETTANLLIYAVGAAYMLLFLWRFYRRDFDSLCDHPLRLLLCVFGMFWLARFGEVVVALLLQRLSVEGTGENNEAVIALAKENIGQTAAMAVFLAPIVEESLFRAGVFGLIRKKNRVLAYVVSMLLFALYHVWQAALYDPSELLFVLQYLPAAFALAYVYEYTDSIWGSIFLHMLTNGVSLLAMTAS